MKINDVRNKIDASYNTIKKFILSEPEYHEKIDNVLHVTNVGYEKLLEIYGIKSGLLSDDSVDFYKIQMKLLHDQLLESRQYNRVFANQIESKDSHIAETQIQLRKLEFELHQKELEIQQAKHDLEIEKNKSIFKKIFRK